MFSRHAPSPWKDSRALLAFFKMTRPLETVFRLLTAPLRDTPDIFLLGETRCGTTTLSAYLKELPGAQAPFCPWIHPLEGKETFYFVSWQRPVVCASDVLVSVYISIALIAHTHTHTLLLSTTSIADAPE